MKTSKPIKELLEDIVKYQGAERGTTAKIEYDYIKLEIERKRNSYQFIITILLTIITIINLGFSAITLYLKLKENCKSTESVNTNTCRSLQSH